MNSEYLMSCGFKEFPAFEIKKCGLKKYPEFIEKLAEPGVYVFCLKAQFPRLKGKTDILYIGQAGNRNGRAIWKRLNEYRGQADAHDKRMRDDLERIPRERKSQLRLFYKFVIPPRQCGNEEAKLLGEFYRDHIELPPMNMNRGAKIIAEQLH